MLEDWRNVDLNSITKQTLYTMEDSRDEHRKLIIQCKTFHQGLFSLVFIVFVFFQRRKGKASWEVFKWHRPDLPPWDTLRLTVFVKWVSPDGGGN